MWRLSPSVTYWSTLTAEPVQSGNVMSTPGHTPACVCYVFDRFAIIGDTLFMPDSGTARCDFPGGDAATLYDSIQRLFELAPRTRLLMCHDYAPGGRTFQFMTSVADERTGNIHVRERISREEYIAMRTARDHDLAAPKLLDAALPFNMAGGLIAVESLRECWKRAAA